MSTYIASYSSNKIREIIAKNDEEAVSIAKAMIGGNADNLGTLVSVVRLSETVTVYSAST